MSFLDTGVAGTYTETEPIEIPNGRSNGFSPSVQEPAGSQITTSTRIIDSSHSSVDRYTSSSFTANENNSFSESTSGNVGNFVKNGPSSSYSEHPSVHIPSPSALRQDIANGEEYIKPAPEMDTGIAPRGEENATVDVGDHFMDIASFPTDKLLDMLTALLTKIIKSNDALGSVQNLDTLQNIPFLREILSFRGKQVPGITLKQYFQRIQKYCPTTNDVLLSLLVHFDRIAKKCNSYAQDSAKIISTGHDKTTEHEQSQVFVMDSHNIHRLIIAAVTVSTKFISDFFYSNARYARVGGISLQELNHLELQFLVLCDFKLIISLEELQRYADLLYKFWEKELELGNVSI